MNFLKPSFALILISVNTLPYTQAENLNVISSGGLYSSIEKIKPLYEKETGNTITLYSGSSMGESPTSIPHRLAKGEKYDVVLLASSALDKLINQGYVQKGSHIDIVNSKIGMAVKHGAPKPDISNAKAFEETLLKAKSIAYSASASGKYLEHEVFTKFPKSEADNIQQKAQKIIGARVAEHIANGDFSIGFQQISEIKPFVGKTNGVDYVGPIPAPYQKVTIFSAGIGSQSAEPDLAKQFITYLKSTKSKAILDAQGLEQISN